MLDKHQQLSSVPFFAFLVLFVLGGLLFPDLPPGIFTTENKNKNKTESITY